METEISADTKTAARLDREYLSEKYKTVRSFTEYLTEPLETEDFVVQVVTHASPAKWHLAHTSWFFETFLLKEALPGFKSLHPQYNYLFNSYYLQTGEPHCRDKRGNLSRPTVKEVFEYRKFIDEQMLKFLESVSDSTFSEWGPVIEIGLNHEQQHQELLLTDIKYMFAQNPLYPVYSDRTCPEAEKPSGLRWIPFEEGVYKIGHKGDGFGYDNEFPRHKTYIQNFALANRLVTNAEYLEFIRDGGYNESKWWLDEGFATVEQNNWNAPLYWIKKEDEWYHFTLHGIRKVDPNEPVTHVSYFEAEAYARWAGCRLPTEQEWEIASCNVEIEGNFADTKKFHPSGTDSNVTGLQQMFGDVWEWTQSSYSPYPGYKPLPGALGEYNGKFMCNQYVLRGGSCATSESHIRRTYRNFFHANERWQFMGIRLARDED
ncbi:MAG: ergothioneine biosynthesis protein EgtB [Balneolaceae bacterium]